MRYRPLDRRPEQLVHTGYPAIPEQVRPRGCASGPSEFASVEKNDGAAARGVDPPQLLPDHYALIDPRLIRREPPDRDGSADERDPDRDGDRRRPPGEARRDRYRQS